MISRPEAFIDNAILAPMLTRLQEEAPGYREVLVGIRRNGKCVVLTPDLIGEWLGEQSFPSTLPDGFIQRACSAAETFVADGDLVQWGVAVQYGPQNWHMYHRIFDGSGQPQLISEALRWQIGAAPHARTHAIEQALPGLRRNAFLSPEELRGDVTMDKARARDTLAGALKDLPIYTRRPETRSAPRSTDRSSTHSSSRHSQFAPITSECSASTSRAKGIRSLDGDRRDR